MESQEAFIAHFQLRAVLWVWPDPDLTDLCVSIRRAPLPHDGVQSLASRAIASGNFLSLTPRMGRTPLKGVPVSFSKALA